LKDNECLPRNRRKQNDWREEGKRAFPSHSLAKRKRHILGNKESKDFVRKYRAFKNMTF
jgi:hypothetical protein